MRLDRADISAILELLREVSSRDIMPRFRHLSPAMIRQKTGRLDQVTEADEAAEAALAQGLRALFPGTDIIGEEQAAADPSCLALIEGDRPVFIIDPIDGTGNYAADLPLFGVMVTLVHRNRTLAGFIHDPVGDDTAIGLVDEPAWIEQRDGGKAPLQVAPPVPVGQMAGAISWRFLPEPYRTRIMNRLDRVAASWDYRCAAHQYRMLAGGHCEIQLFGRTLPWDHAAGVLIHRQAGGYAAKFDGAPWLPSDRAGGLILAPDQASWLALHEALIGL
jgi:fructose-1,6-bisphosphatase/inositol monophosphatase family enzyme